MAGNQVAEGAAQASGASEYIQHHLQPLQLNFSLEPVKQTKMVDFTLFNADTVFVSVFLGALVCLVLWWAAKRATSGVPGRFQAAVEILVEFVEEQAKGLIHNKESRKAVSPMALTVFLWIFVMNAMDLLPVDILPWLWGKGYEAAGYGDASHAYLRILPTADLSATFGMSLGVLLVTVYYNIKIKGLGGWGKELISAPFGDHIAIAPINLGMQAIEFGSKTISHGMRLFGNMFAGELVFMLIALLGGAWQGFSGLYIGLGIAHLAAGSIWAIFHILVITLQAYIFMMLTLIYVSQAHSAH